MTSNMIGPLHAISFPGRLRVAEWQNVETGRLSLPWQPMTHMLWDVLSWGIPSDRERKQLESWLL